jgi:hypothetical protein
MDSSFVVAEVVEAEVDETEIEAEVDETEMEAFGINYLVVLKYWTNSMATRKSLVMVVVIGTSFTAYFIFVIMEVVDVEFQKDF